MPANLPFTRIDNEYAVVAFGMLGEHVKCQTGRSLLVRAILALLQHLAMHIRKQFCRGVCLQALCWTRRQSSRKRP